MSAGRGNKLLSLLTSGMLVPTKIRAIIINKCRWTEKKTSWTPFFVFTGLRSLCHHQSRHWPNFQPLCV